MWSGVSAWYGRALQASGLVNAWLKLLLSTSDCPLGNPARLWLTRVSPTWRHHRANCWGARGFSTGPCGLLECNFCFPSCRESCSLDSAKCLEKPWLRMWDVSGASLCGYKGCLWGVLLGFAPDFLWLRVSLPVGQREAKSIDCRSINRLTG